MNEPVPGSGVQQYKPLLFFIFFSVLFKPLTTERDLPLLGETTPRHFSLNGAPPVIVMDAGKSFGGVNRRDASSTICE